ncbi:MAG: hypothetical protein GY720_04090 [bacterium]|nr:hypothetical protein [bacterium]
MNLEPGHFEVCESFVVDPEPPAVGTKLGVAANVRSDTVPLHGLRHPPEGDTNGWYLWRGEYSDDPDFFVPLHFEHVGERAPEAIPYVALPPGWRFLVATDREDIWFDATLLEV